VYLKSYTHETETKWGTVIFSKLIHCFFLNDQFEKLGSSHVQEHNHNLEINFHLKKENSHLIQKFLQIFLQSKEALLCQPESPRQGNTCGQSSGGNLNLIPFLTVVFKQNIKTSLSLKNV
jgi:hypothetical protein